MKLSFLYSCEVFPLGVSYSKDYGITSVFIVLMKQTFGVQKVHIQETRFSCECEMLLCFKKVFFCWISIETAHYVMASSAALQNAVNIVPGNSALYCDKVWNKTLSANCTLWNYSSRQLTLCFDILQRYRFPHTTRERRIMFIGDSRVRRMFQAFLEVNSILLHFHDLTCFK